jgi:hypothetical protein
MGSSAVKMGRSLSAVEVKDRMVKSVSEDVCYISLRALTDETRFTLLGPNLMLNVHNKYSEAAMKAYNK